MTWPQFRRAVVALHGALLVLPITTLRAQHPAAAPAAISGGSPAKAPAEKPRTSSAWRLRPAVSGALEYDDNVFLLSGRRKSSVESPSAGEKRSGRYADMTSARDAVASLNGALRVTGRGYGGRPLELRPSADLELHALNTALTNVALGLAVEQDLARAGRLRGRASFQPSTFRRNYLAGAVDEDGDGFISSGERRYDRGEASDMELNADFRHRLRKSRKSSPLGATLQLGAGFRSRSYAAPFAGRAYAGPTGEARLLLDPTKRFGIDLGYDVAILGATPTQELMLVEEPAGRRAVTGVADRSRTEHTVSARARTDLTRRSALSLELERRARTFTSQEPTDVRYRGRRDARNALDAELTSRLRSGVRAVTRVRFASQTLARGTSAAGDEVDDYARLRAALGLRLTF